MNNNVKIANELIGIVKTLTSSKSNDPSDFNNFKKHIVDFCKEEKSSVKEVNKEDIKNDIKKELRKKVESMDKDSKFDMSRSDKTDTRVLDILADDENQYVRRGVAYNRNTRTETLDKLSEDDYFVRRGVAGNGNTSTETLDKLSSDKDWQVRWSVARNKNTSSKTLDKLSNDKYEGVRMEAKRHLMKKKQNPFKIDFSKMSPQLRQRLKGMTPKQIGKFIGWLKENF